MPQRYMIGGPNGTGKTSVAMNLLPDLLACYEDVNADAIAAALSPFSPETTIVDSHFRKITACLKVLNLTSTCKTLENEYNTHISQFSNYTFFDSYEHSKELAEQCKKSSNIFKVSM